MAMAYFKGRQVPVVLVILGILAYVGGMRWAEVKFITRAQAEQSMETLSSQIDSTNKLISDHIDVYEVGENKKAIKVVKNEQYSLRQYVAASGSTPMTNQRAEDLTNDLSDLLDIKACLQRGGKHCDD